ncbi:putative phosphoesterase [Algoriphagus boseongensis]|uniref:Putative phosphoesterase n=1 Tax=Algoriphagus boseongensis TaxID=1442587 RepID=A0A4R6TA65_9BACT|nr:ligase-associated DNA damage response endonuclease PdeM [Algoriphagus boseongensis]TDQ19093.1 putative phosphoesterase [Algoriphagus boseongensis]
MEIKEAGKIRVGCTHNEFFLEMLWEKALWIKELKTLLIADLHFGKAAHFRKSGIPIPEPVHDWDLKRLETLHSTYRPVHTYFLGDLFHSDWNEQWEILNSFLEKFIGTQFHLIKGNHDILAPSAYRQSILQIHEKPLKLGKMILSHEPMEKVEDEFLNICGHIHPGVFLKGKARQGVRLPCFHLAESVLTLPSFGNFTGSVSLQPKATDKIWVISGEKVIPLLSGTSIG